MLCSNYVGSPSIHVHNWGNNGSLYETSEYMIYNEHVSSTIFTRFATVWCFYIRLFRCAISNFSVRCTFSSPSIIGHGLTSCFSVECLKGGRVKMMTEFQAVTDPSGPIGLLLVSRPAVSPKLWDGVPFSGWISSSPTRPTGICPKKKRASWMWKVFEKGKACSLYMFSLLVLSSQQLFWCHIYTVVATCCYRVLLVSLCRVYLIYVVGL